MGDWFGEFFGKLIFGHVFNQIIGGGSSGYSAQDMDWTQYEQSALNTVQQLQNQMGQITSWGETEKNWVDVAGELDIKSATGAARTDVEDVVTAQQELDVKTGFHASGLVDEMKEEEYSDIYGALTEAYGEFDIRDQRDKANIDITTEQLLNQITNQINAISTQYAATTGDYLELSAGSPGWENVHEQTFEEQMNQAGTPDIYQQFQYGTGMFGGTTPNPYGMSGSQWNMSNMSSTGSNAGASSYNYSNSMNPTGSNSFNNFANSFASSPYGTENTPTATSTNPMQSSYSYNTDSEPQNPYTSLLSSDVFATAATTGGSGTGGSNTGGDDYDWMNAYKKTYRGGNVFGQGGII